MDFSTIQLRKKVKETPEEYETRMQELDRRYDAGEHLGYAERTALMVYLTKKLTPAQKAELRARFKEELKKRTVGRVNSAVRRMIGS